MHVYVFTSPAIIVHHHLNTKRIMKSTHHKSRGAFLGELFMEHHYKGGFTYTIILERPRSMLKSLLVY